MEILDKKNISTVPSIITGGTYITKVKILIIPNQTTNLNDHLVLEPTTVFLLAR
jgi:hypothetical protein